MKMLWYTFGLHSVTSVFVIKIVSVSFGAAANDCPQRCIAGPYQKTYPSSEGDGYVECLAWKNNTCCSANKTKELRDHDQEESFYECDPNTIEWIAPSNITFQNVPIYAVYCDAWFESCKTDKICFVNWLTDYAGGEDGMKCLPDQQRKTYAEMYGSGAEICNFMLGSAFRYETSSTCMVMDFDSEGPKPNDQVVPTPKIR